MSHKVTAADYDEDYYELLVENYEKRRAFSRDRAANLASLVRTEKGERLLDLGCGIGASAVECANRGAIVTGLDYTTKAIEKALIFCEKYGREKVDFIVGDCSNVPLADESFDKVLCADLVEHLYPEEYLATVREAHRVLKADGEIIIYTPSPSHFFEAARRCVVHRVDGVARYGKLHVDLKSMDYIIDSMESSGFAVQRSYYLPSHVPLLCSIERITMRLPVVGDLFRRRICVTASKEAQGQGY